MLPAEAPPSGVDSAPAGGDFLTSGRRDDFRLTQDSNFVLNYLDLSSAKEDAVAAGQLTQTGVIFRIPTGNQASGCLPATKLLERSLLPKKSMRNHSAGPVYPAKMAPFSLPPTTTPSLKPSTTPAVAPQSKSLPAHRKRSWVHAHDIDHKVKQIPAPNGDFETEHAIYPFAHRKPGAELRDGLCLSSLYGGAGLGRRGVCELACLSSLLIWDTGCPIRNSNSRGNRHRDYESCTLRGCAHIGPGVWRVQRPAGESASFAPESPEQECRT